MLTYAGHNGKVYGYQEEVVRFSPNEFRFYGLIKTMFFMTYFDAGSSGVRFYLYLEVLTSKRTE